MFARSFAFRAFTQQCYGSSIPLRSNLPSTWRYLSSSVPRAKAVVKPKAARSPVRTSQPAEETLKFAGRRPEGFGKLERKVAKEGNILLFKAPSHRTYVLGAYGIAAFCFAYSVYNSNIVFRDPIVPLPMWQQGLFGGICVMMSVMGTVFLVKTSRLINSVNAINLNGKTYLRFSVRSMVPFRKPYEVDVLPRQVAFSRRLVVSPDSLHPEVAQTTPPKKVSIYRAPLTKMSQLLWKLFRSVRQLFTQEDFILMEIEGQKGVFRMDSAGYVSEDFLVLGNPLSFRRP
ncbi:uncharacterized protein ACLA_036240 [Aspergillus clavatus NRRL 1]|uniref:Uncharacterized protein n=1 Tax=Aspergillus clavatus (strain ATCC 1007 / CBS 513.65 / DSM 816 / NCTC 3887 / NRRL 1 / QM 1276 / 107) TaxID=344612 RepID=A1CJU7_ASPCL|nr:uncharacterized protein ACLA_036240 [Aspergillus clavatus NRRL 1]EAW09421.1 hypothetical protein ACLA_036240 [Aspergillus clavatus NRRL 1]